MDPLSTIIQLLVGAGGGGASANVPARRAPPLPPQQQPQQQPQERPIFVQPPIQDEGELPGGTFTPQRQEDPGLLSSMFGPEASGMMRRIGAGMANVRGNSYGDPWITAAQGFGGATAHADEQDQLASQSAADQEKLKYDRGKDAREEQRLADKDATDTELRRLADSRAAETHKLTNRKTAMEIRRMARQNNVTTSQMLEIERIAQAAAENMTLPEDRERVINETRQRLIDQVTAGEGITGAAGGLSDNEQTYTNPDTGEQIVWRDGQWVDTGTGEPWGQ